MAHYVGGSSVPTDFAYKTTYHNNEPITPPKIQEFKEKAGNPLVALCKV
jgi:hypothetical protein